MKSAPLIVAIMIIVAQLGCRAQTLIDSEPRGARVEVGGIEGTTPFTASLPLTTFDHYYLTVEKPGFVRFSGEIPRETSWTSLLLSLPFPPALLSTIYRPADYIKINLAAERAFPAELAYTAPWVDALPPLPPGMLAPARNRDRTQSRPAPGK